MPDLAKAGEMPHGIDDIMRGLSFRLVDDERAVKRRRLRLALAYSLVGRKQQGLTQARARQGQANIRATMSSETP